MAPTGKTGWRSFRIHEIAGILSQGEGCIRRLGLREERTTRMGKRKMWVHFITRAATCERKGIRRTAQTLDSPTNLRLDQRHRRHIRGDERTTQSS